MMRVTISVIVENKHASEKAEERLTSSQEREREREREEREREERERGGGRSERREKRERFCVAAFVHFRFHKRFMATFDLF